MTGLFTLAFRSGRPLLCLLLLLLLSSSVDSIFHKTRVEMMGSSISQSFQHQLNWKNIFLVATNRYCWDTQQATLKKFGFWKNQSGVNLVSWYCWQLYVVFHFQTNSNALWLENFLLFVRTISWLHFLIGSNFRYFKLRRAMSMKSRLRRKR